MVSRCKILPAGANHPLEDLIDVSEPDLHSLIRLAYRASHKPSRWPAFLDRYAELNAHTVTSLSFSRGFPDRVVGGHCSTGAEDVLREYNENWSHRDPYAEYVARHPDGIHIEPSCAVFSPDELVETTLYRDFLSHHGLGTSLGAVEKDSRTGMASLGAFNGHLQPTTEEQLELAWLVMPHVLQALSLYREFAAAKLENLQLREALEIADAGFVTLDENGEVTWSNRYASTLFDEFDGIEVRDQTLRALDRASDKRLNDAIRAALCVDDSEVSDVQDVFTISRDRGRPLQAIVAPLRPLDIAALEANQGAFVVLRDPKRTSSQFAENLRSLHGLTRMESVVVEILTEGFAPADIADALNVSIHTVRSHLRRAFAKTGTGSQAELVSLATRGIAPLETDLATT